MKDSGKLSIRRDYDWTENYETHARRRAAILKKYPQIRKLMVHDPMVKWKVLAIVAVQLFSYYYISKIQNFWILLALGFFFSGVLNHALIMAIHDISHNSAFGYARPLANDLLGFVANLPIGFPISGSFRSEHPAHHARLGRLGDADVPLAWEGRFFHSAPMKIVYLLIFPLIFGSRTPIFYPKPTQKSEAIGLVIQVTFNVIITYCLGWRILFYMFGSTYMATSGLHPVAGHFLTEHTVYFYEEDYIEKARLLKTDKPVDKCLVPNTFSYYGPLNALVLNVGYHVEHHDFPGIPHSFLPKVREIASEFYEPLCYHTSWTWAMWRFIVDPRINPYARILRKEEPKSSYFDAKAKVENDEKLDIQNSTNPLIKRHYIFYQ